MHNRWRVVLFAEGFPNYRQKLGIIHGFLQVRHRARVERSIPIWAAVALESGPPVLDNWDLPLRDNPASQTPTSWQNYGN